MSNKPPHKKGSSGGGGNGASNQINISQPFSIRELEELPSAIDTYKAGSEKQEGRDKWRFRLEVIGFVVVVIGAALAGGNIYLLKRSLGIATGQWQDLRHNFAADERAWIKFDSGEPPGHVDEIPALANSWGLSIENLGKSPAYPILLNYKFEIVPSSQPPTLNFNGGHGGADVTIMFPGDKRLQHIPLYSSNGDVRVMSEDELRDLTLGKSYIAVFIQAKYRDQFGEHWTRYCFWKGFGKGRKQANGSITPDTYNADRCIQWSAVGDGAVPRD